MNTGQNFPRPNTPLVDTDSGNIKQPWLQFFISLWNRTGSTIGNVVNSVFGFGAQGVIVNVTQVSGIVDLTVGLGSITPNSVAATASSGNAYSSTSFAVDHTGALSASSISTVGNIIGASLNMGSTTLSTYSNGTWTPVWSNLTVVGTPTYAGSYVKIGALVCCSLYVTSTTSTASTSGATSFTGLPYPPVANSILTAFDKANATALSTQAVNSSGTCNTPTWGASAAVIISFCYIATTN